jgi:DNA repair exonuclease SbcCD ATPase subunit
MRSKLAEEKEKVHGLQEECQALRTQINAEHHKAEQKYADLQRRCADERETALAVEKALREHYATLCTQTETERKEAEEKYVELEHRRADEKEIALSVEMSLKGHYDRLNTQWQRSVIRLSSTLDLVLNVSVSIEK